MLRRAARVLIILVTSALVLNSVYHDPAVAVLTASGFLFFFWTSVYGS